jgi:integrase
MATRFVRQFDTRIGDLRQYWLIDFVHRHADGRRERIRRVAPVATEAAARQWERRLRTEVATIPHAESGSLRVFVERRFWPVYPSARANRATTKREKEIHLRCHILPALGDLPLSAVNEGAIDTFAASLGQKDLAPKTIANVLTTLGTVLRAAVSWGALTRCPRIVKPRVPAPSTAYYTSAESHRLLHAVRGTDAYAILLLALHTGVRAGELLAVRWDDVDFAQRHVTVRRSRTRDLEGPPKSGRERVIPMSADLVGVFAGLTPRGDRIFSKTDGTPLRLGDLHHALDLACERAGVRRLRFHDLRHTFASQLAAAGAPLTYVQAWLGHADLRMLLRYVHLAGIRDVANVMAALGNGVPSPGGVPALPFRAGAITQGGTMLATG